MPVAIRQLLPADSLAYRRLRLACLAEYPASFGSSVEEEEQLGPLYFEKHIEAQEPGAFVMGAFNETELVGMCAFLQASRRKVRHQGDIRQVCVSPAYKRQGLGRALLLRTLQAAFALPDLEQIYLGVIVGNAAANQLYESLGFEQYGLQKRYLRVNDHYFDHRLMVLNRASFTASPTSR
ncbi:GNAT family N-acetyltransferase [Hymenobacter sublimis]|uniref:GNAT family N-acetyltransferase n=1 Tax=Hymenobacter sublimis TaxID=2933777 RepID=A0ABY4J9R6_9BACT|nr:GNAT family protein [Hymenobacter sublimis]UPL48708.1 GNAT family N-acetyltransferase [Hymenobacter sublimis]